MVKEKGDNLIKIAFWGWLVQWFLAVWSPVFKGELFLSGILFVFVAVIIVKAQKEAKKK